MASEALSAVVADFVSSADSLGANLWLTRAAKRGILEFVELEARLNRAVTVMPGTEREKLKARFSTIIPPSTVKWDKAYWSQCKNVFVEIVTWERLSNLFEGRTVEFKPVGRIPTPDVVVTGGGRVVAAAECKDLGLSDDECAWLASGSSKGGAISVGPELMETTEWKAFANKVRSTISAAGRQLNATGLATDKYIFMNVLLDTPFWLPPIEVNVKRLLRDCGELLKPEGIVLWPFTKYDPERRLI